MRTCQASAFRAGQGTSVHDHVFRSVLLPKAFKVQTHRRKRWQRGSLQTYARRFGFSRHKEPQYQQIVVPPEPAPPKGPSRLGIAILVGAGLLLVATWHKLTSRGPAETLQQRPAAATDVVGEPGRDASPSQQEFGGQREGGRVTGGEIQARIQQVRAAIEAAKAANRPDILRTEIIELRALRDLAADLYSFNTLTIEAQEVQSKMASLREQHAETLPSAESLRTDSPLTAGSGASTSLVTQVDEMPQPGQSLVSAFKDSQLFEPDLKQQPQADSGSQPLQQAEEEDRSASSSGQLQESVASASSAAEPDEAGDEVAELANALWEGAEDDVEADAETDAEPPRFVSGVPVTEEELIESTSTESNRAVDRLDRLQDEPDSSEPPALASTRPSDYGNGAAVTDGSALEMPLLGEEKEELREMQQEMQIEIHSGGVNIPHPAKAETGGEDAFFTSRGAVGVADGVSAWAREGVNAALYSSCIMQHARERLVSSDSETSGFEVLQHSSTYCAGVDGSSTAVIAVLKQQNILEVTNLGDCGFRVIREGSCIFASDAQQHSFNCPYQLASPTKWPEADKPEDADIYEVELLPGDIVVLGSDGLFDNMWDRELESIVAKYLKAGHERNDSDAKQLALHLANAARKNALNVNYKSPWILEAAAAGKLPMWQRVRPRGGKLDDCTAVVVFAELAAPVQAQAVGADAPVSARAA